MNNLPPCDHDCCPPTHCELDRLKAENARLRDAIDDVEQLVVDLRNGEVGLAKIDAKLASLRAAREGGK